MTDQKVKICTFPGCNLKMKTQKLCNGHYLQKWRGVELHPLFMYRAPDESFESILKRRTVIDLDSGCCIWQGSTNKGGHGVIRIDGKTQLVHRLAFKLFEGSIPEGLFLDHEDCISKACWNVQHMRPVTNKQNSENRSGPNANSTSGVRGVTWNKRHEKWVARVGHNGHRYNLGYFERVEDAEAAVIAKRLELFTHNAQDRKVK